MLGRRLVNRAGPQHRRGGETQARLVPGNGDQARSALLDHRARVPRLTAVLQPGVAGAERGMPGERQLPRRREDAYLVVGELVIGLKHERGLGQIRPVREPAHLLGREPVGAEHYGQRVARDTAWP